MLCYDYQSSIFMLKSESKDWSIGCLWLGNEYRAKCAPVPNNDTAIGFIEPQTWQKDFHVIFASRLFWIKDIY